MAAMIQNDSEKEWMEPLLALRNALDFRGDEKRQGEALIADSDDIVEQEAEEGVAMLPEPSQRQPIQVTVRGKSRDRTDKLSLFESIES